MVDKKIYKGYYNSPLGKIILLATSNHLIGLWFDGSKYVEKLENMPCLFITNDILEKTKSWLDQYFQSEEPDPRIIPILLKGTSFCMEVWQEILSVPYGKTITYGQIAKKIALAHNIKSMSAQAVGSAVGHNPISIIVPCHRIVGKNNKLTGYAGGLDKRVELLKLEKHDISKFSMPK